MEDQFIHLTSSEFKTRSHNAQKLMEERGIDAILLTERDNVFYFSGYKCGSLSRPRLKQALIVTGEGESVLVLPSGEKDAAEENSTVTNLKIWEDRADPIKLLGKTLKNYNLSGKTIAIEQGEGLRIEMLPNDLDYLRKQLGVIRFINVADVIWKMRTIKSPLEQRIMREVCGITSRAYEKGLQSLREGMSDWDLARIIHKSIIDETCPTDPLDTFLHIGSGHKRQFMGNPTPSTRRVRKGDLLYMDGGASYLCYHADMIRMASVGRLNKKQEEMFNIALEAQEAALQALGPNRKIGEVYSSAYEIIRDKGCKNKIMWRSFGHGLGLGVHEPPPIDSVTSKITLKPGMVVAIEPSIYDRVDNTLSLFLVEDNLLITSTGYENLTPLSKDMYIV